MPIKKFTKLDKNDIHKSRTIKMYTKLDNQNINNLAHTRHMQCNKKKRNTQSNICKMCGNFSNESGTNAQMAIVFKAILSNPCCAGEGHSPRHPPDIYIIRGYSIKKIIIERKL